ncbi:MAG: dephospho-CoA kinase [Methylomonas sp.]|nr:MAG: dephospho-CoA kinase [Methylomonas sp.]PPD26982.1 MAG: dephospho-CoA kinase [Methylomonas sp.]PPD38921.1 MAG: dephospho-CoA kinase [Methylomonas sp.]PPD42595.1 MAG: dephospho-CoA kinase [Methylomonas sp.]PPD54133.1 MAG: dephospho-CoA kinase [Methylomonas sp.]
MFTVALTGGIASGKSTVSALFAERGVDIIDADIIARRLVEPGQPTLAALFEAFGRDIANADGTLDRARLRDRVFSDVAVRQRLNAILHPRIFQEIDADIGRATPPYCVVVVPLLFETARQAVFDRVLLVDCAADVQLERLLRRDRLDPEQATAILDCQASRAQRLSIADDVIDNAKDAASLAQRVESLHNFYLFLATDRNSPA